MGKVSLARWWRLEPFELGINLVMVPPHHIRIRRPVRRKVYHEHAGGDAFAETGATEAYMVKGPGDRGPAVSRCE